MIKRFLYSCFCSIKFHGKILKTSFKLLFFLSWLFRKKSAEGLRLLLVMIFCYQAFLYSHRPRQVIRIGVTFVRSGFNSNSLIRLPATGSGYTILIKSVTTEPYSKFIDQSYIKNEVYDKYFFLNNLHRLTSKKN